MPDYVEEHRGSLRAAFDLPCSVCKTPARFVVIGGEDYSVTVDRVIYGCTCEDRPEPEEAEGVAAEMFDDHKAAVRWTGIYGRHPEEV